MAITLRHHPDQGWFNSRESLIRGMSLNIIMNGGTTSSPIPRRLGMRMIGPYHVAGLGNGTFIVCDESIECFLVEADNPENAVKIVEEYLKSVFGEE